MPHNTSDIDLTSSVGRLSYLASLHNAQRYLEIGVNEGATFFAINLPCKVAVDPSFQFVPEEHAGHGVHYFPLPSDTFFANLHNQTPDTHALYAEQNNPSLTFDLIFIDGLHTFEQSFRDFENSLAFAHNHTLWVLDDTVPSDEYSALPDVKIAQYRRRRAGKPGMSWHGDVFKTVFALHDTHPDFSYCTLTGGNPQTIVWKSHNTEREPVFPSLSAIDSLSYYDMLNNYKLLMPIDDCDIHKYIGKPVTPATDAQVGSRKKLIKS